MNEENEKKVYDWHRQDTRMTELGDVCTTASAAWGGGGNNMPYVLEPNTPEPILLESNQNHATIQTNGVSTSLPASAGEGGGYVPMIAKQEEPGPAYDGSQISRGTIYGEQVTPTLIRGYYKQVGNTQDDMTVSDTRQSKAVVRRLTPLECERLQGFPDGWTDIGEWTDTKGKKHKEADSPRYKALGNSIAVGYANGRRGFWCWLAERMVNQLKEDGNEAPTMASLFDGIGGFPLAYSAYGCKPVWASEIEEFPIAVTKIRFPEE